MGLPCLSPYQPALVVGSDDEPLIPTIEAIT